MPNVIKEKYNSKTGLWTVFVAVGGVVVPIVGYNIEWILRLISRVFGIAF